MDATKVSAAHPSRRAQKRAPQDEVGENFGNAFASVDGHAYAAGTGRAVTDLIFSIAKRDVTFFSGTALISFL